MGAPHYRSVQLHAATMSEARTRLAATMLSAYFHVEEARAARRLVWRFAAIAAGVGGTLSIATQTLNAVDWAFGLLVLGGGALAVGVVEMRARLRLVVLTADLQR